MSAYVVRLRVLPAEASTDPQQLLAEISKSLGPDRPIKASKNEPIAFGLYALVIDIVVAEAEGAVDSVETAVSGAPLVGQAELQGVSRQSSTLHR